MISTGMPILSIFIPSFNHSRYICACLRNVILIPEPEKEIIIIDDGSTDDSIKIISNWITNEGGDYNIKFIHRENRGVVATANECLSLATGIFIYGVASDDLVDPEGVQIALEHLKMNPNLQFILGNAEAFWENNKRRPFLSHGKAHKVFFTLAPKERNRLLLTMRFPTPLLGQATVIRRSALVKVGGWDERLPGDDYPLFVRLLTAYPEPDKDFLFLSDLIIVRYRQHETNTYLNLAGQADNFRKAINLYCPEGEKRGAYGLIYFQYALAAFRRKRLWDLLAFLRTGLSLAGILQLLRGGTLVLGGYFARRIKLLSPWAGLLR